MSVQTPSDSRPRFLTDRMLGTLTHYLRFLGYDTLSAVSLSPGNTREDTILLRIADAEDRILLTGDHELARRGGVGAVLIESSDVLDQVRCLVSLGLISPEINIRMQRCSLCNGRLRPATEAEVRKCPYAPQNRPENGFFWCPSCHRLYWSGTHGRNLSLRLIEALRECDESGKENKST